jgi:CheY-like chemotaxis protein
MNRLKMSMSLEQQGHTVALAENGRQALDMLEAGAWDVVLLDIVMPEMDGYEVLERMKRDPQLRDIPVIVISALDETESAVRSIEMGAEDYLPKSFDPILLRARLNSSLQRKKLRDLEKMYLQQEVMLRQSEKLAMLGKLSAGMAHELNNPAAAVKRGADQLRSILSRLQEVHLKLGGLNLTDAQLESLLSLDKRASERARKPSYLDAMARSDQEAEWETWLHERGISNAWEIAPTLAGLGYDKGDLEALAATLSPSQFSAAIDWLNCSATIYGLVEEIDESRRLSERSSPTPTWIRRPSRMWTSTTAWTVPWSSCAASWHRALSCIGNMHLTYLILRHMAAN